MLYSTYTDLEKIRMRSSEGRGWAVLMNAARFKESEGPGLRLMSLVLLKRIEIAIRLGKRVVDVESWCGHR